MDRWMFYFSVPALWVSGIFLGVQLTLLWQEWKKKDDK